MAVSQLRKQDATIKFNRTLLQGLAAAVVVALLGWLVPLVLKAQSWEDLRDWRHLTFVALQVVLTAVFAFLMRTRLDDKLKPGSRLLPQDPPGQPSAPPADEVPGIHVVEENRHPGSPPQRRYPDGV
jgi:hypothetical protein